ncbi:hypothetical protein ANCCAN_24248 [Ancylostoma caninum]|uniref:Retrotransposon gag domain-containing protein n=1 Tax=Ancylostoma caninum TaxID=29170 RepID=A0A368FIJ5_ANCCA|nr:hypothetical protein ANCCAN_24248 [Ancylostoma caninum]
MTSGRDIAECELAFGQFRPKSLIPFSGSENSEARDLIDGMSDPDKNNYKKVVQILQTHYESPHLRSLVRQKLPDCKQNFNESVHDFAERMKKLVKRITLGQYKYVQNERLLDEFLDRLKPALKFHVKASNPPTYDDAVVKALTYESLLDEALRTQRQPKSMWPPPRMPSKDMREEINLRDPGQDL